MIQFEWMVHFTDNDDDDDDGEEGKKTHTLCDTHLHSTHQKLTTQRANRKRKKTTTWERMHMIHF